MDMDFDVHDIEIPSGTTKWGPYSFNFRGALPDPDGDPIADVAVQSFLDGVETTAELIDGVPVLTGSPVSKVTVLFKYPGAGLAGKHYLKFVVMLLSGGVRPFLFGYVETK